MDIEDDVFFAELSEQIALLIMDEEEEFPVQCPPIPVQGFQRGPQPLIPPQYTNYELGYMRESKGTGVFIPRSTPPRRKSKPTRSHLMLNTNSQKQQVNNNNNNNNNKSQGSNNSSRTGKSKRGTEIGLIS